ncbi:MAG: DUF368 domain-containing protein [Phycisphaerales bacterium JB043]
MIQTSDASRDPNPPPRTRRWSARDSIGVFVRGFAMGAADIVPGVSGGTIALITGIYQRFIDALGSLHLDFVAPLLRGRVRQSGRRLRSMHWDVLVPIALGIMLAVATMSSALHYLMDAHPGPTFAFFFGLIAASSWVPFKLMQRRDVLHIIVCGIAAVVVFLLVGIQPKDPPLSVVNERDGASGAMLYAATLRSGDEVHAFQGLASALGMHDGVELVVYDPNDKVPGAQIDFGVTVLRSESELASWAELHPDAIRVAQQNASRMWLFCCGMIAISAMLLPGVSGSFLLLLLGQYYAVLGAISRSVHRGLEVLGRSPDPLHTLNGSTLMSDLTILMVFNLGVVTGVVLFSRVIRWLLRVAHDLTMAVLTGLMIGALHQPGRVVVEQTTTGGDWLWVVLASLLGAVLVVVMNRLDTATSE